MAPININNGKPGGATNNVIHGMATLRINPTCQSPATVIHPSPGVDVTVQPGRDYPQPTSANLNLDCEHDHSKLADAPIVHLYQ
ncbi:hypothetical protein SMACR_05886 [Sordaria macrospora]|uniref:WGS project CABT00000000 data, contig 2.24 n=2 Tax=Sordaria macrospora TaxID=5147 RepID=F7W3E6_SORMK|nr:uncharacterized protein SMAC_05886 [Sordaria macrospora k-hell]KAA8628869.1 hypothetical protein SMACR_05886 [Sordaria macrospora]WPJ65352.1 hypothetical protein SMAC4_05886 [Sordaria macrospora]CCC12148.1 unnamed protein product [Sordaria macrospora k-hell]